MSFTSETAVLATLATVLVVGLGFLRNPTRATRLWSLTFTIVMIAGYCVLVGDHLNIIAFRIIALALFFAAPVVLWAGVRERWGKPPRAWIAAIVGVAIAVILALLHQSALYELAFQIAYLISSVFAALTAIELVRSPDRGLGMVMPLTVISAVFPLFAVARLVTSLRFHLEQGFDLAQSTTMNTHALPVYLFCAVVSVLYLSIPASRMPQSSRSTDARERFRGVVSDRLARAEANGERSWSLVCLSLDDADDTRRVVGELAFENIAEMLETQVRAVFPASSDIDATGRTTVYVLLTKPRTVIRGLLTLLDEQLADIRPGELRIQLSVSAGWASSEVIGYRSDDLIRAAEAARDEARRQGGGLCVEAVASSDSSVIGTAHA